MTDNVQLSRPAPTFEGFAKFADGTVISLQCYDGHCLDCPDEAPDDEDGQGVLDGNNCEHGCGHGPAAGRTPLPRGSEAV